MLADKSARVRDESAKAAGGLARIVVTGSNIQRADLIDHYSQSTVVQTGAGEPNWNLGSSAQLSWSGPVLPTQSVHLIIAPPWLVRPLRVALVALLAWLLWRLFSGVVPLRRLGGSAPASRDHPVGHHGGNAKRTGADLSFR